MSRDVIRSEHGGRLRISYEEKKIWGIMRDAAMSHDAARDVGTCMDGSEKNGGFRSGR